MTVTLTLAEVAVLAATCAAASMFYVMHRMPVVRLWKEQ